MECQDTIKSLKINIKKKINTVVLVVEGAEYEFDLLKQIFRNILHYSLITKSRNKEKFKEYNEFIMRGNEESKIIIINTKNSNIGTIEDDEIYRNELYKLLYEKYNLDIKNIPVYYIWDRDKDSNKKEKVLSLLNELSNAYENENYENGLLLLSYPCCEAYTISNFEKNKETLNENIKDYVNKNNYNIKRIDKYKIQRAILEMIKTLDRMNINFDIENMKKTNIYSFNYEENYYIKNKMYMLLSFISVILIDLGIITFRD